MSEHIDLIFREEFKIILKCFSSLFGIRASFSSPENKGLISGSPQCMYCQQIRKKLGFESVCKKLDYDRQQQALESKKLISYTCHGGMIEAVLPVFAVDKHLGYIMIGQFRNSNKMPAEIREQWKGKFGNDSIYKTFLKAPKYTKEKTADILKLFSLLSDLVVSKHLIMTSNTAPINSFISYLDEHPELNISISDAAKILNCSVSYLTHNFRKTTGQSFKEYVIKQKLDKADELLNSDKIMKIYEIAKAVGYENPFTFSRIYKKYRGCSPSKHSKSE